MRKLRRKFGVLLIILALVVMQLPVGSAEAASSSAFYTEGATLVAYRGNDKSVSVPNDVTVIGSSAFEDNLTMEKVTFPKSLRRIKPYAFWGCDALKEITFGSGLKEIGDYAFTNCKGLTELTIPSSITSIGIRSFAECSNLTSITIPETVVYIHETAFDGCKKLVIRCTEGSYADKYARDFYRRQALMEDEDMDSLDDDDQADDPDLSEQSSADGSNDGKEQSGQSDEGNVIGTTSVVGNQAVLLIDSRTPTIYQGYITEQAEHSYPVKYRIVDDSIIADQAYYKDGSLQEIIIPEGITEIGELAFARSNATALYIPNGAQKLCYAAFYHCDNLCSVTLPESIRKVEPKCFQHTAWTKNFIESGMGGEGDFLISGGVLVQYRGSSMRVSIPDGVRVIAAECFQGHSEIEEVSFPESLTDIGEAAFEDCKNLSEIVWKNGILTIGDRAFSGCALTEITIPGTVQSMGIGAFDQNVGMEFLGKQPERTHESSAEKLANEKYRMLSEDNAAENGALDASLLVLGMTGARAALKGANRPYTLMLESTQEAGDLQKAREAVARNIGKNAGSELMVLHCLFYDDSGIPITRLGKEALTIEIPVPESMDGQEIEVYQYDRNGQLAPLSVRYAGSENGVSLQIGMQQVYDLVLSGTGKLLESEQIVNSQLESDHTILQDQTQSLLTEKTQQETVGKWTILKWSAGALLLLLGLFFALSKVK